MLSASEDLTVWHRRLPACSLGSGSSVQRTPVGAGPDRGSWGGWYGCPCAASTLKHTKTTSRVRASGTENTLQSFSPIRRLLPPDWTRRRWGGRKLNHRVRTRLRTGYEALTCWCLFISDWWGRIWTHFILVQMQNNTFLLSDPTTCCYTNTNYTTCTHTVLQTHVWIQFVVYSCVFNWTTLWFVSSVLCL